MATTFGPHEVEQLRSRVSLYLQVMLIIDLCAHVSDAVSPLFIDGLKMPVPTSSLAVVRYVITFAVAAAWSFAKFAKPGRLTLLGLESGVTVGLAWVYVQVALVHMAGPVSSYAPVFALFGIMLLLGVRASLVPSPVRRTVAVGLASVGCLFVVARESISALEPQVIDGLVFMGGAFVLATAVTSHVIYGLRREVRQALQLGQYTLEQKLGEGGMGTVYRARHAMLRRQTAIKLIKPEWPGEGSRRSQALQRFEREAQATANLK